MLQIRNDPSSSLSLSFERIKFDELISKNLVYSASSSTTRAVVNGNLPSDVLAQFVKGGGGEGGWRDIYMEGRGGRHEGERAVTRDY